MKKYEVKVRSIEVLSTIVEAKDETEALQLARNEADYGGLAEIDAWIDFDNASVEEVENAKKHS